MFFSRFPDISSQYDVYEIDVSTNINLEVLRCGSNSLKVLDLSNNTKLRILDCAHNNLTELNLSQNLDLVYLGCGGFNYESNPETNVINQLDLSNMEFLTHLYCQNIHLEHLNIKNGNNINLNNFRATGNNNLFCVEVDDDTSANNASEDPYNRWVVDDQIVFSLNCTTAGLFDQNLKNELIIYPNPASEFIYIDYPNKNYEQILLYDILGKLIKTTTIDPINITEIQKGFYELKIIFSNGDILNKKIYIN